MRESVAPFVWKAMASCGCSNVPREYITTDAGTTDTVTEDVPKPRDIKRPKDVPKVKDVPKPKDVPSPPEDIGPKPKKEQEQVIIQRPVRVIIE
jgi:hypothetical protein